MSGTRESHVSVSPEEFKLHYDYYIASYNLNDYIAKYTKAGDKYKYRYKKFLSTYEALNKYYTK